MSFNSKRILSLDVFRGLTIVLMVLVNSQGSRFIYPILDHASWNGCTLADLVFPSFLFIVGITTVISLTREIKLKPDNLLDVYWNIFKRSALLFLFGLLLNAFPYHFEFATLRVYGILQRIAGCYFICALLFLNTSVKTQIFIFLGILLAYWYFMVLVPMPGLVQDQLTRDHNWVSYVDHLIFSPAHLWKDFDPEGLLSTVPSVATTLLGVITGSFLLTSSTERKKCLLMILFGLLFLFLGWMWGYSFPINKNIWTSSFVLWTGGIFLIVFALCFYTVDVLGYKKWAFPFEVFGMNALFIFIFHVMLLKIQVMFVLPLRNGTPETLRVAITDYLFGGFSQENAGLFYAILFILLNYLVALFLYKRKLFIKL